MPLSIARFPVNVSRGAWHNGTRRYLVRRVFSPRNPRVASFLISTWMMCMHHVVQGGDLLARPDGAPVEQSFVVYEDPLLDVGTAKYADVDVVLATIFALFFATRVTPAHARDVAEVFDLDRLGRPQGEDSLARPPAFLTHELEAADGEEVVAISRREELAKRPDDDRVVAAPYLQHGGVVQQLQARASAPRVLPLELRLAEEIRRGEAVRQRDADLMEVSRPIVSVSSSQPCCRKQKNSPSASSFSPSPTLRRPVRSPSSTSGREGAGERAVRSRFLDIRNGQCDQKSMPSMHSAMFLACL